MKVYRWNTDKPHRCPVCHRVVKWEGRMRRWRLYVCGGEPGVGDDPSHGTYCGARFAWWGWAKRP